MLKTSNVCCFIKNRFEVLTMNESGITSQYGFLFQRKVFVLYVLENMNVKQRFCFEGKDDVEIAADEKIYELDSSESNCVQVKSGQVNQSCFSKVVGNWLLLDSVKPERYTLFIENELKFDLSLENVINEMLVFVEKGKSKKKTSIAYKVYEQYKDDLENDDAQKLKDDIKNIIDKIKIDKCSIDELDLRLETIFFEKYCTDIVEYNIAKRKRLEKFIQDINKQIDESIKQKKAYSLVLSSTYQEYSRSKVQQQKIFKELQLDYTGKYSADYKTFCDFRSSYVRKAKANSKDLVYLSQSSFSLAEEIKIYNFMKNQSSNMVDRKERIKRLLSIMSEIVSDEPDYEEYTRFIKDTIETLDEENVILSLTDYNKAIKDIEKEKKKLDYQIELLKASSEKLSYEDAMKKVGLLEHIFVVLQEEVDIVKYHDLSQEVENLKKEIKELKSSFNQKKINDFNKRLTEIYLGSGLEIQHLQDDIQEEGFALEFDPFRLCLSAKHKKGDNIVNFMPGSMARQTHIQMLVYLTMFEYLNKNFSGFIYMPLLVIDSANQPMGVDKGNEAPMVYILNADYCAQNIELRKVRNILFTAITRSRAWVRICGVGDGIDILLNETKHCTDKGYALEFKIPTEAELKKMNLIHRDRTEQEIREMKNASKMAKDLSRLIKEGKIDVFAMPELTELFQNIDDRRDVYDEDEF